jgi:hypothetical protein
MLKKLGIVALMLSGMTGASFAQGRYYGDRNYYQQNDRNWNRHERREWKEREREERRARKWRERNREWREHERWERRFDDRRYYYDRGRWR